MKTTGSMELATSNVGKVSQAVVSYCKRKYKYIPGAVISTDKVLCRKSRLSCSNFSKCKKEI